jgi:non-homologous end joining protein Ku
VRVPKGRLIINHLYDRDLAKNQDFEEIQPNYFKAIKRTEISGYHIDKNEIIRLEDSEIDEIIKFSKKTTINNKNYSVVLFHLDEKVINKLKNNEAEKIYTHFD